MKWNDLDEALMLVEVHAELTCTRCNDRGFVTQWDEEDCYNTFKEAGWKSYNDYCYCPRCAKVMKLECSIKARPENNIKR